ncbi:hypothetical protein XA68_10224 [Ophiocordyceps unilateralis]|uniref:Uncharacterized protein n=1 Tax=Ophiocordyceps unilateralis TaxID=268505 RepID=A0A2A9P2R4_OPHUN|nr:hypothetical protein XA68_10224 [Ophiocordyceps unilateralis]
MPNYGDSTQDSHRPRILDAARAAGGREGAASTTTRSSSAELPPSTPPPSPLLAGPCFGRSGPRSMVGFRGGGGRMMLVLCQFARPGMREEGRGRDQCWDQCWEHRVSTVQAVLPFSTLLAARSVAPLLSSPFSVNLTCCLCLPQARCETEDLTDCHYPHGRSSFSSRRIGLLLLSFPLLEPRRAAPTFAAPPGGRESPSSRLPAALVSRLRDGLVIHLCSIDGFVDKLLRVTHMLKLDHCLGLLNHLLLCFPALVLAAPPLN